jgi:voltage-gated potassium channel
MGRVLTNEARNLIGVTSIFCLVLFGAGLAAYIIERDVQPDKFGSIPQAMWWAVVTLSTTGYGDAIPQSFAGRVLAGLVMMSGIGIFALWAGILATGFYQEVRRQDFVRNWQVVAAVPLFQKLGPAALVEIVRALRPRIIPAGAVICRKDETGDQMFFIVEGRVSVATPNPVDLGPGSFFGEMALISGEPRSATVSAATTVSLLSLHSVDFQMLCSSSPEIADIIRKTALERRGAKPKA